MRVTDWLNTVMWLTNISVCSLSAAAEEEHWSIPTECKIFARKQMAKWACDTIVSKLYVHRPWPRAGCFCAHSTIDTHCTARNLKKIPAGLIKKILRENFYKLCRSWARQWGAIQYNRWRLCCRELHGMFQVSWGLKWYFGKIISPSTSSRDL